MGQVTAELHVGIYLVDAEQSGITEVRLNYIMSMECLAELTVGNAFESNRRGNCEDSASFYGSIIHRMQSLVKLEMRHPTLHTFKLSTGKGIKMKLIH